MPANGTMFDLEPPRQVTNYRTGPCTQKVQPEPEASPALEICDQQAEGFFFFNFKKTWRWSQGGARIKLGGVR